MTKNRLSDYFKQEETERELLLQAVALKSRFSFIQHLEELVEQAEHFRMCFKLLRMTYPAVKWQSVRFCLENALKCLEDESDTEQEVIEDE